MHKNRYLSLLAGVSFKVALLLASAASAEVCTSGSFLYKLIHKGGELSDELPLVLRHYTPGTREKIGGPIIYGPFGPIGDGGWVATFELDGRLFSLARGSNQSSNWRNDETIFFMEGYSTVAVFNLFAMSKVREHFVEYDLLWNNITPPDQLHLTTSSYLFTTTYAQEASLFNDPSGDELRSNQNFYGKLQSTLANSTGAWALVGCNDEHAILD